MNYVGAQPLTQCGFCAPSFDVALLLVRHLHWTAVALPPLALAQGIWRADYHTGGGSKRSSWRPAKFTVALLAKIPGFIFSLGKTESRTRPLAGETHGLRVEVARPHVLKDDERSGMVRHQPWLNAEPVEAATSRAPSAVAAKAGCDSCAEEPNAT